MITLEDELFGLKGVQEKLTLDYAQTLATIEAQKQRHAEGMARLAEFGCSSLEEATDLIASLESDLSAKIAEIREILG